MNLNISLNDWHGVLQGAMWWEDLHPDLAILLYKYARKAYHEGLEYYVRGPSSGEVELTKIYEQFKLLHTLKAEYK
jgi:hypothetical protein